MAGDIIDPRLKKALCRYEAIRAYIAAQPGRGQKGPLLQKLAAKTWTDEQGEPMKVEPETLRVWVRRHQKRGLEGLMDKARTGRAGSIPCIAITGTVLVFCSSARGERTSRQSHSFVVLELFHRWDDRGNRDRCRW